MAELAAGPHAAGDSAERAQRQDRLQRAEATFHPLPFDSAAARAYGHIYAAIMATGPKARGPRAVRDERSTRRGLHESGINAIVTDFTVTLAFSN
jgi:predicted nucleic acid-binding protein